MGLWTRHQAKKPTVRNHSRALSLHCVCKKTLRKEKQDQKRLPMKKIEAIVRLSRFEQVRDALAEIEVRFFTLTEVKGFGLQSSHRMVYRGSTYDADYIARLQLDILCQDDMAEQIVQTIMAAGRTGEVGDGKIVIYDVEQIVRIRTAETNEAAI